jgi:hypothetical protein
VALSISLPLLGNNQGHPVVVQQAVNSQSGKMSRVRAHGHRSGRLSGPHSVDWSSAPGRVLFGDQARADDGEYRWASWPADPNPSRWKDDPGYKEFAAFVTKYMTPAQLIDPAAVYGFVAATIMTHVLKQCGDDLSRENILRQATNIKDLDPTY